MLALPRTDVAYGVALEGGGARGAYQMGAWKALRELNIEIKGVVGTSVGALNGAMMVQDEYEKALHIWENMCYDQISTESKYLLQNLKKFELSPLAVFKNRQHLRELLKSDGIDIKPLKKMIDKYVDEDKIRQSQKDYGLTTVRLNQLKGLELFKNDIKQGHLKDFILASAYLPVFKQEALHGNRYLDGGFYNTIPINMLAKKGYRNIITIRLADKIKEHKVKQSHLNIINIFPNEKLSGMLEFNAESCKYNINLGYFDTLRVFKGYLGRKYYIECDHDEDYFFKQLVEISINNRTEIMKLFNVVEESVARTLFEQALPRLARILKMQKDWTYKELMIAAIEFLAEKNNINRFKLWSYEELFSVLKKNITNKNKKNRLTNTIKNILFQK